MKIVVTDENGKRELLFSKKITIHELLQKNGINVQNYLIRYGKNVISEKEILEKDCELELIKIVSGG